MLTENIILFCYFSTNKFPAGQKYENSIAMKLITVYEWIMVIVIVSDDSKELHC